MGWDPDNLIRPDEIAAVELDPDLMLAVIEDLSRVSARPGKLPDINEVIVDCYCDYTGLDPNGVPVPEDTLEIAALLCRVEAMIEAREHVTAKSGTGDGLAALAQAACTARLIDRGGRPAFQVLDFLSAFGRAKHALAGEGR
jgi:hypothetical protein